MLAREELTDNLKHVIETYMEKEDFEYYNAQLKEFEDGKAPKPIWVQTRWAGYFKPVGTEEVDSEEAPASVQDQHQEMQDVSTNPAVHKC